METVTSAPLAERPSLTPPAPAPNVPPTTPETAAPAWPLWQRVLFRFFCVYFVLQIEPWDWFRAIPGVSLLLRPYDAAMDWAVRAGNARLFHIRETLVPVNGSGGHDTEAASPPGLTTAETFVAVNTVSDE